MLQCKQFKCQWETAAHELNAAPMLISSELLKGLHACRKGNTITPQNMEDLGDTSPPLPFQWLQFSRAACGPPGEGQEGRQLLQATIKAMGRNVSKNP